MIATAYALTVHNMLEWAAVFVGARIYLRTSRLSLRSLVGPKNFAVPFGCIAGAALGDKAVHWIQRADQWSLLAEMPWLALQGQSIVGGLLGGLIGVEVAKKSIGQEASTGDRFVAPVLVGLTNGRVGCFLAGLQDDTYGNPTRLPWGVDFGDGVARHPTQLYDIAFALTALAVLRHAQPALEREPGLQFKLMLAAYLLWRLLVDGLKPVPYDYGLGLSGIQVVCLVALICYVPVVMRQAARLWT